MQAQKKQQVFEIQLTFESGQTRWVKVKASTSEVAQRRALKRNPTAVSAKL